jgi:hypothetical protein
LRPADLDLVKRYRDVGVDEVVFLILASNEDELKAGLDMLAKTVVGPAGRV